MGNQSIIDWHGLTVQMVLSFIALILLTAAAVGLPTISLIRNQIEPQAWTQVSQGGQASQALYAAMQSKFNDLVTLTAQRPTLKQLLNQGDMDLPAGYLQILWTGTDLDLLMDQADQLNRGELQNLLNSLYMDTVGLQRLVDNLLESARLEADSPDSTKIVLKVTTEDNWVRIAVADQGPGISDDLGPSLFRHYVGPDWGASRSRYGAGLGLPVVKAIMEAHGGAVGMVDRPEGGPVFWFTLAKAGDS